MASEGDPLLKKTHSHGARALNHSLTASPYRRDESPFPANRHKRAMSLSEGKDTPTLLVPTMAATNAAAATTDATTKQSKNRNERDSSTSLIGRFTLYIIYALVNVIISAPGLYGYAAVIFNHPIFSNHMNALSKLVIFSSFVHQLGFALFSTLPFAIGTVQDAGLIFLSTMSSTMADAILNDGGTEEQVVSTAVVVLSCGTAALGLVLMIMGHFRFADAVAYLPMPVIGGYLAFIGYFCLEAGVGLCIDKSMVELGDWVYLKEPHNVLLAVPGLVTAFLLTYISRTATSAAFLPATMVAVPVLFYVVIYAAGAGLEGAREGGWVGEVAPSVPVSDLFKLVDFSLVRWDVGAQVIRTWFGMVFVVSFASCLDVAAISIDMGEALDTNKELRTVGICNFMSGLTLGYTGSYIFSQTIFTYRTGVHSKWIGIFIMVVFMYIVTSPINILEVAPSFFLGSTLIFIGYDLLYEWLVEIRYKVFLTEYCIVWATFIAIHIVGIDAGIIIGVLVAIVDHVVASAHASGVTRVLKKSRAVWSREDYQLLQAQGYHPAYPKIMTLEVAGSVFFGSAFHLLQRLAEEIGMDLSVESANDAQARTFKSPRTPSFVLTNGQRASPARQSRAHRSLIHQPPKFVALDLTQLSNLDASAARGCFLQLVKACCKQSITVCAAGATPRIEWMLRSHEIAYESKQEEDKIKAESQSRSASRSAISERILMFATIHEALEFCENALLHRMDSRSSLRPPAKFSVLHALSGENASLSLVFSKILGSTSEEELRLLRLLDGKRYHDEVQLVLAGEELFRRDTHADAFYTVLKGSVAVAIDPTKDRRPLSVRHGKEIMSGAGPVKRPRSLVNLMDAGIGESESSDVIVASTWPVGGVFGYCDFLLERPRTFRAVSSQNDTTVAKITRSDLHLLQSEEPSLDALIQRVLLQASVLDLANCTCDE